MKQTTLTIKAACSCHQGKIRLNNEDNFFFDGVILNQDNSGLEKVLSLEKCLCEPIYFGVYDGMGGEAFGEEASYLAAETLLSYAMASGTSIDLFEVIQDANQKVCYAARNHNMRVMGSTAVLLKISQDSATMINLGDSKAFLFRGDHLEQISVDHTDQALLKQCGILNRKPKLTQHLGIEPSEMIIEPYATTIDIQFHDHFLLCSDGLTDMISIKRIEEILRHSHSPEKTVDALIKEALTNGGNDNITVIICEVIA